MYKINRWTLRYQWGGVQLAAIWLAELLASVVALAASMAYRGEGKHHKRRASQVVGQQVTVRDIQRSNRRALGA